MPEDLMLRIACNESLSSEKRMAAWNAFEDMMWARSIERGLRFRDVPADRKDQVYATLCALLGDSRVELSKT